MKTYNELYINTRNTLKRSGIEAYALEARVLVASAAGKTVQQLLRDLSLYTTDQVEERVGEYTGRRLQGELWYVQAGCKVIDRAGWNIPDRDPVRAGDHTGNDLIEPGNENYVADIVDSVEGYTNISNGQVSVLSVDIGLPQLAMHSPLETAGVQDVDTMIRGITAFYNTHLHLTEDGSYEVETD